MTLADGRVLALGGHPLEGDARHTNTSLEVFDPATGTWALVGGTDYDNIPGASEVPERANHSEYPRCHVLRDGTLFVASNMADGAVYRWTPGGDPEAWSRVADAPPGYSGNPQPYTTVLLPLSWRSEYSPEVLVFGQSTAYTIQPLSSAFWVATSGRALPRRRVYPMATLLPTGEVFVSGGTETTRNDSAERRGELYDPVRRTWKALPAAERARNYHSTALLLPNGAVWHSGSNRDCEPGVENSDRTVEIFEPWYFCEDRPRITAVARRACVGETLNIETSDGRAIDQVVLVRCGSFTHAWNPDQRLVEVPFERDGRNPQLLHAFLPDNSAVLVPGYYLVFILDGRGDRRVPSEGRFVQVCRGRGSRSRSARPTIDRDDLRRLVGLVRQDPMSFVERLTEFVIRESEKPGAQQHRNPETPAQGEAHEPGGGHHVHADDIDR